MKASECDLLSLLERARQFVIPIYQRSYRWDESDCRQLWKDILQVGGSDSQGGHFVGSVVYVEKGLSQATKNAPLLVIDGQQRLTTVTLILEALARHLGEDDEPAEGFTAKKIRNRYLTDANETDERHYKLILGRTDKKTLTAIVGNTPLPENPSIRIEANFAYFNKMIDGLNGDYETLCHGLERLVVVDVALERSQDNPQLIFESMNSTGRALGQADLIRNYVLMGLEPDQQTRLYNAHWRPMEVKFGQEAYGTDFDKFMRHYLTLKTGSIPRLDKVYDAFKTHSLRTPVVAAGVDKIVEDIHNYADYYCAMALGRELDPMLASAFQDLRELTVDVAYPFLLEAYADYANKVLSAAQLGEIARLVESYVFRRAVCAIPTNSMNKTFATLGKSIDRAAYVESVQAALLLLPTYRRFPSDTDFGAALASRDLYNFPRRTYLLRRLENHNRKEPVAVGSYTIEHIMPQNPELSDAWKTALGDEWERVHATYLHTLGNLTLTGYNSEYSDHPFPTKRDMEGGFRTSPLWLNERLLSVSEWNETEILKRTERLTQRATEVWVRPNLSTATLDKYRPKPVKQESKYSLADYPYLEEGRPARALYDELSTQLLSLDPIVSEVFNKLYVAYKAVTNFVDVIPLARGLRLSINIPFHELSDPAGVARDTTDLGRWGNGDVEVNITSKSDIPYALGLIRQAYERQLDSSDE